MEGVPWQGEFCYSKKEKGGRSISFFPFSENKGDKENSEQVCFKKFLVLL